MVMKDPVRLLKDYLRFRRDSRIAVRRLRKG